MEIKIRYIKFIFDSKKIFFVIFFIFKIIKAIKIFLNRELLNKIQFKNIRGHDFSIDGKYDLLVIYSLLNKYKPINILELGSGASTLVFALYAREMKKKNINVKFISLEENGYYLAKTKEGLESINDDITNLELCGTIEKKTNNEYFINYDFNHTIAYDFVYIDGPVDNKKNINFICDDINIISKNSNFTALVDYRLKTYNYLRNKKSTYNCKFSFFNKSGLIFKA